MRPNLLPSPRFGLTQSLQRLRRQPRLHAEDHDLMKPHPAASSLTWSSASVGSRRGGGMRAAATARAPSEKQAAKGPRLHLRRTRRDPTGAITHPAVWIIKDDGRHRQSTGCRADDRERAEQILAEYIAQKRLGSAPRSARDPAQIPVADVISRYLRDVAGEARQA
jgi:hypothetical protein